MVVDGGDGRQLLHPNPKRTIGFREVEKKYWK
jgi:hypothetical protein